MQIELTPDAEAAMQALLSDDSTPAQIVERALQHEVRRAADLVAIEEGLDDIRNDRTCSIDDVDREIREKHGFASAQ